MDQFALWKKVKAAELAAKKARRDVDNATDDVDFAEWVYTLAYDLYKLELQQWESNHTDTNQRALDDAAKAVEQARKDWDDALDEREKAMKKAKEAEDDAKAARDAYTKAGGVTLPGR
jgi:hypothetical protein